LKNLGDHRLMDTIDFLSSFEHAIFPAIQQEFDILSTLEAYEQQIKDLESKALDRRDVSFDYKECNHENFNQQSIELLDRISDLEN
jgi:hypothetical protein